MTTPYRTAHFFAEACFDPDPDPDPDPGRCPLRSLRERTPEARTLSCSIGPRFFFGRRCLGASSSFPASGAGASIPSAASASGLSSGRDHSDLPSLV